MRKTLPLTLLFLLSISSWVYAGEYTSEKCLAAVAAMEETHADRISQQIVSTFLETLISNNCQGSAEYSEWSNEALFKAMEKYPTTFFSVLRASSRSIQRKVDQELGQPIHDLINYPRINESISKITDENLRDYAIKIFSPHHKRHLDEIKDWEEKNNVKWSYDVQY